MIRSFKTEGTARLFHDERVRQWQAIESVARRKLNMVHAAARLEKLEGARKHQHSIRINDQYRVCFEWREGDAYDVEIVDYH